MSGARCGYLEQGSHMFEMGNGELISWAERKLRDVPVQAAVGYPGGFSAFAVRAQPTSLTEKTE